MLLVDMHGYSSHTYSMVNADNERTWVKWHIRSMQGIEVRPYPYRTLTSY